ncbi:unnamed protein product [Ilex paraguariensis]|uniref:Uncharacterized protein n=1 Tax=Ilex paraguariensis TaxID=185542 RepID=A0ABC8TTQ2_9AQUA
MVAGYSSTEGIVFITKLSSHNALSTEGLVFITKLNIVFIIEVPSSTRLFLTETSSSQLGNSSQSMMNLLKLVLNFEVFDASMLKVRRGSNDGFWCLDGCSGVVRGGVAWGSVVIA